MNKRYIKAIAALGGGVFALLPSGLTWAQTTPVAAPPAADTATPAVPPPGTYPFQNPDLPAEARIDDLLSHMTLDEKLLCLGTFPAVPRLGVRGVGQSEGLHGLAVNGPANWSPHNGATPTTFPQEIGLGETWDPDLVHEVGRIEGYEARYIAQNPRYIPSAPAPGAPPRPGGARRVGLVLLAPNADLGRDPRWGRTEECYGEDPFFNGTMAVQMVRGLQGDDPKYWQTAALMKHFLANSNEDGRDSSSSNFDERLWREYYSVAFRMGIQEGGSRAYMASYNAVNGVPSTVNPYLKKITVDEWGQNGIISTDGGAMRLLITAHKAFPDDAHAVAACVKAGINRFLDRFQTGAQDAVKQGLLTESEVDTVLRGQFRVMIRLGMLDPEDRVPYAKIGTTGEPAPWTTEANRAVARRASRESVVLLKNTGSLLPLDRRQIRSLAVIGPRAGKVYQDWYSGGPAYNVTPVDGIHRVAGPGIAVTYVAGDDIAAAATAAKAADIAIVCLGNHPTGGENRAWAKVESPDEGREAIDRQALDLPQAQEELLEQVRSANPKTVLVLVSSFPYAVNWAQENVPAIVHLAHNGQEEGNGLADILFGDVNPAGRLVQTWPKSLDQLPPMMDYDIRHGRTYLYFKGSPLYPFGFGLSYTSFAYSGMRTDAAALTAGGTISVSVDVKNTGKRAGDEVVQLYARHLGSSVERPQQELKGFQRVTLQPGETKTVTIPLRADQLAYWDVKAQRWVLENDRIELRVGASSADIRQRKTIPVNGGR